MVQGSMLVVILVVAIILMVFLISKCKFHPFVALFAVALAMGLAVGMAPAKVLDTILNGFGGTCRGIGIVILLGTIIGAMLEKSGAAFTMADSVLKVVGEKRPALAMSLIGWIVSIPVFCDSGFVILSSLNKSLARRSGVKLSVMAIALSTGLYATHTLVPPTPGPIAAANELGADLGMVIMWGAGVSLVSMIAGYIYALVAGSRLPVPFDTNTEAGESYEELKAKYGKLPSAFKSFAPILIPLILIGLSSFVSYPTTLAKIGGKESTLFIVTSFLGNPVIALSIGVILCFFLAPFSEEVTNGWIGSGVKEGANIIMITAAGGGLGAVIAASGVGKYIGEALSSYNFGIFLPFIISAALKTAQGSSTVAIVTTAQIIAPMMESLGLGGAMGAVLATLSIGSGAMVVSHANDSYFWVVTQFSDMDLSTAYKAQTVGTLIQGVVAILAIYGISLYVL
ncbi:MAG: GntP family permease [Synergistaceae bacterium]|nr:GntP family permease [Synergistaceae bacterium]MBQ6737630.1 GntP family permease [Synergistaceae bacterium]MBQ7068406.1 GntP family permease [Synergistaceae bacterium]MBR0076519.1 GntP family permease [Synergistaceae bacterium]MBR0080737.1 GntP family permease [Synergistaceae bacterium]